MYIGAMETENTQPTPSADTSESAKALSSLGASKGGLVRASTLTPSERSDIARNAVMTRWKRQGKLKPPTEVAPTLTAVETAPTELHPVIVTGPYSMFRGELHLGPFAMECHVLNDHRRVFTQREIVKLLSGGGRESGGLSRYIDNIPLDTSTLNAVPAIQFKIPGTGNDAVGREVTFLIELCDMYLQAEPQLKANQKHLARLAQTIVRSTAKVGIIALVDEATGFQKYREQRALQIKLQAFVAEEMQEWARKFPLEFWLELARLEGIHYSPRSRPLRWGKYIMAFVYDAIDKDVGKQLRIKNPNPHHGQNHHQWLKQYGTEKLKAQIERVITIMKLCNDMDDFRRKFNHVFKKSPLQASFDDINWGNSENSA